ncbi:MAG TPA: sucrose phosphorylase [Acidothermaceae bacterium]|nr:sucrose phosphorylase [Acidothermaceae bacterium]
MNDDNRDEDEQDPTAVRRGGPQLIAYADRFGGSISGVTQLLRGALKGAFTGVHLLPFYTPFDGADAGFDPRDHTAIDPRLGDWPDIQDLARSHDVMADVIVNHMSTDASPFRDVVEKGDASPWAEMFLTMSSVFPDGATESDLTAVYRPRPGLPFTPMYLGEVRRLVWTTFTSQQVDLDVRSGKTWAYLTGIVDTLSRAGVRMLRLDAVGYVVKTAGTSCFMTPETLEFVRRLRDYAHQHGVRVLLEIHAPYQQQLAGASNADFIYDFALPPLVLHALMSHDFTPLTSWLEQRPRNTVTVLDTHDGIGIVDAGPTGDQPGLLDREQLNALVAGIHANSKGTSQSATGAAASNLDLYQVNCTFYDALGRDDGGYLLARLVQLFVPGVPQVYYVGLLAGHNDVELLQRTGVGRDINRHHYSAAEIDAALGSRIVQDQLTALRFRASHPAFTGSFTYKLEGTSFELRWQQGDETAKLSVDTKTLAFLVDATSRSGDAIPVSRSNFHDLDSLSA